MYLISAASAARKHDAFRRLLTVTAALAATLSALGYPLAPAPRVAAQTATPPITARALRLSKSAFPPKSIVHGARQTNEAAYAASRLHTVPFARLGRLDGYLQMAWWWVPGRSSPLTLQYMASVFSSADTASAAYGDARASLWELGHPMQDNDSERSTFSLVERDGHQDVFTLLHRGPLEIELRLRYASGTSRQSSDMGVWYLHRAVKAASHLAHALSPGSQPPSSSPPSTSPGQSGPSGPPTATGALPPIYVAPLGTGPVVKSPSLMAPDQSNTSNGPVLDPGTYRQSSAPLLVTRATQHPALLTPDSLARYVTTASVDESGTWYEATALYGTLGLAGQAFDALVRANPTRRWLKPYALDPQIWNTGPLRTTDATRAWKMDGEIVVAVRLQNVVMVLASTRQQPQALASLAGQLVGTVPTWLHAQGTQIVDAAGNSVRLAALNWYGAEQQDFVVGGLDFRSYQDILQTIKRLGYNSVRLPFSNQLIEQNPVVTAHVAANPELAGMHALDILDRIISYAGALGISVILDNHRSEAGWSSEENGLWYTPAYPDAAFVKDWATVARRYAVSNVVVGADLRNEPHGQATWGDNNAATDWKAAAERAGNAALASNPHLLILVEGIQTYGQSTSYWWGGSLMGVATAPVSLHFADGSSARSQLVYSAHDYGPDNCGAGCPWFNATTTYDTLSQVWEEYWGYITDDPAKPYAAPVWVGEFGTCNYDEQKCLLSSTPGSQGQWFSSLVRYIASKNLGWAYWSANGTQSTGGTRVYGNLDWYGLFTRDWSAPVPWLHEALHVIQGTGTASGTSNQTKG